MKQRTLTLTMRTKTIGLVVIIAVLQICSMAWAQKSNNKSQPAIAPPCTITGVVRDAKGVPLANALVFVIPEDANLAPHAHTDRQGRFTLKCRSRRLSNLDTRIITLMITHRERHLAGAIQSDGSKKELDIKLVEAISVSGRVLDAKGKPIGHAMVDLWLGISRRNYACPRNLKVNPEGRYEIATLPSAFPYSMSATAEGYGESFIRFHGAEASDGWVKLKPIVLARANCSLSGTVVDVKNRPLAGVRVECDEDGQPNRTAKTNDQGKFTIDNICAGPIDVWIRGIWAKGRVEAKSGDRDIVIVARKRDSGEGGSPGKSESLLTGKALPAMHALGFAVPIEHIKDRKLLLCFIDMQQRPSRNLLQQLAKEANTLGERSIAVVLIQTTTTDKNAQSLWLKEHHIPFTCYTLAGDVDKKRLKWGVTSQPWLILTDKSHIVQAEGFGIEKLETLVK
jgi:protocatechuate 3,4-dioxygenase beta subunit